MDNQKQTEKIQNGLNEHGGLDYAPKSVEERRKLARKTKYLNELQKEDIFDLILTVIWQLQDAQNAIEFCSKNKNSPDTKVSDIVAQRKIRDEFGAFYYVLSKMDENEVESMKVVLIDFLVSMLQTFAKEPGRSDVRKSIYNGKLGQVCELATHKGTLNFSPRLAQEVVESLIERSILFDRTEFEPRNYNNDKFKEQGAHENETQK